MKKLFSILLCLSLVVSLAACGGGTVESDSDTKEAASEPVELIIGHIASGDHGYAVGTRYAMEAYEEIGDGSITFNEQGAAVLGTERSITESVIMGDVGIGVVGDMIVGSFYEELFFANFPGVINSYEEVEELYLNGWIGERIEQILADNGVKLLAVFDCGFRWIGNNQEDITSISQLKGMKMRVPETPYLVDLFEAFGALPTTIALTELPTALQQGVVVGHESAGPQSAYPRSLHEVQNYWTETRHGYSTGLVIMSMDVWNSLSPRQQEDLEAAWGVASDKNFEYCQGYIKNCIDKFTEYGCKITYNTEEMQQDLYEIGKKLANEKYYDIFGQELIDKMYPQDK